MVQLRLDEQAVYTTAEAARLLKLAPITVERQIRRGELKAVKFGKGYRLLGRDLRPGRVLPRDWCREGFPSAHVKSPPFVGQRTKQRLIALFYGFL